MDPFAAFPDRVPAPASGPRRGAEAARPAEPYRRDASRFAVRGPLPAGLRDRAESRLEEADLTVVRAPTGAGPTVHHDRLLPVYRLGEGGAPFIPTGRVSLRFVEGTRARDRDREIRAAGYRIVEIPDYAPHFAWLEAASGDPAEALTGLPELAGLAAVRQVEAQMVSPRATR